MGSFILGFLIEALFTGMNLFEKVRKKFNIFFVSLIFLVFSPYILQNEELIILFFTIMVILIIIKFIKIQYINYFSDLFVLTFIVSFFLDNYIKYSIIIYLIKVLLEFGIYKIRLDKLLYKIILNLLWIFLVFTKVDYSNVDNEVEEKLKKEKDKLLQMMSNANQNELLEEIISFNNNMIIAKMSDNHLSMDLDDNRWIYNISKNLNEYIDRPTKQSDIYNYRYQIPKFDDALEFYYLNKILEIIDKKDKMKYIANKLKNSYEKKLIEDDEYKPEWNDDIRDIYLSKFVLYSKNLSGFKKYLKKNEYKDNKIQELLKKLKEDNNKKPNNNMVTIFVSGFLTENKNSFAECFKDYTFIGIGKSDYYFYLWPSYSVPGIFEIFTEGIEKFNGIGCSF